MMVIENKYDHGQLVYLQTDAEQSVRIITSIKILPGGLLIYELAEGGHVTDHYEIEITAEENVVLKTK